MKTETNYRRAWLNTLRIGDLVYWVDPTNVDTGTYIIEDIYYPEGTNIEDAEFCLSSEEFPGEFTAIGSEIYPEE